MRMFVCSLAAVALLGMPGCGDDDDEDELDAAVGFDAPAGFDAAVMDAEEEGDAAPVMDAGEQSFTVTLTSAAEVPVCSEAGASATGSGTVMVAADNSTLTLSGMTFSGLSGTATAAHIHLGAVGEAGPVVLTITDLASPIEQTFTAADYPATPPTGAAATFAGFMGQVRAGETYVNIHTEACPEGELRAQIQ